MALHGTIIKLKNGQLAFETISPSYNDPETIRHVWAIDSYKFDGMRYYTEDDAIGKAATCADGRVSAYLGSGSRLVGLLKDGGSTHAIIMEVKPAPRPRVRKDTELRWNAGHWEKYTKSHGWVAA